MKTIKVVKGQKCDSLYSIADYYFVASEVPASSKSFALYEFSVCIPDLKPFDVHLMLADIGESINFLTETPKKQTEYIENYENDNVSRDLCIFHDLQRKYIDILEFGTRRKNIIILGYTIKSDIVFFTLKSYDIQILVDFVTTLYSYFNHKGYDVKYEQNIKWVEIQQYRCKKIQKGLDGFSSEFLQKTQKFDSIFHNLFKLLDEKGYIDESALEQKIDIEGHINEIKNVSQIVKWFHPFWKVVVPLKNQKQSVLYLQDELPNKVNFESMVYALKPRLLYYYELHWFEDFIFEILKSLPKTEFEIVDSLKGEEFNFFQDDNPEHKREIDILIGVRKQCLYKVIAIECKKTISNDEVQDTNRKIRTKIISSKRNLIDAYIHYGYFNNDVQLDKAIGETEYKYKQSIISGEKRTTEVTDIPYYVIVADDVDSTIIKTNYIINDLFSNWS